MHITEENLKTIFLESGLVTEEDFNSAKDESHRSSQTIPNILIGIGLIPEDYYAELLSPYYGVPIVNLKKETIEQDIVELIPEAYAKSKNILLFHYDKAKEIAKLAMQDPFDLTPLSSYAQNWGCGWSHILRCHRAFVMDSSITIKK